MKTTAHRKLQGTALSRQPCERLESIDASSHYLSDLKEQIATHCFHQRGMILLEVMLATAVFAIAAVSLAVAVDQSIDAFHDIRRTSDIRVHLQSLLAETRGQQLTIGKDKLETGSDSDVVYSREVNRLDRNNFKNEPLNNLYEVIIRAEWNENGQKQERTAQEYVFKQ